MRVVNEPDAERYSLMDGNEVIGFAVYDIQGSTLRILHAEVPPTKRGRGLGGALVHAVLDEVRKTTDYRVVPLCSFVARWMREHPEYKDLATR